MNCPTLSPILLFTILCIGRISDCTAVDKGLLFKSFSADHAEGCYIHNKTLGVCFDIQEGFIKLLKANGDEMVLYMDLGPEMFYYHILDQGFIGHGPSFVHVPANIPRSPDALREFLRRSSQNDMKQEDVTRNHYLEAMNELRYVPETHLLKRLSAALGDNSTRLEILQPFHSLCFNLLKASDLEIAPELRAAHNMKEAYADYGQERQKRGCTRPRKNNCRGMCGKGCWCWSWFCGDCCWHRGCYEHDLCCKKKPYSSYCLAPIGLTCSGFRYYKKCTKSSSWWKK